MLVKLAVVVDLRIISLDFLIERLLLGVADVSHGHHQWYVFKNPKVKQLSSVDFTLVFQDLR